LSCLIMGPQFVVAVHVSSCNCSTLAITNLQHTTATTHSQCVARARKWVTPNEFEAITFNHVYLLWGESRVWLGQMAALCSFAYNNHSTSSPWPTQTTTSIVKPQVTSHMGFEPISNCLPGWMYIFPRNFWITEMVTPAHERTGSPLLQKSPRHAMACLAYNQCCMPCPNSQWAGDKVFLDAHFWHSSH